MDGVSRAVDSAGEVVLQAGSCRFAYRRLRPGSLLVTITGHDVGQFGTTTLDEIRLELLRHRPLELFIDARDAAGATASVSDEWTRFFSVQRARLHRVHVLAGSKAVKLTVALRRRPS